MSTRLQLQGIVFILFAMLLVLITMALPAVMGGAVLSIAQLVFLVLAMLIGILGIILSLSKDKMSKIEY